MILESTYKTIYNNFWIVSLHQEHQR